MREIQKFLNFSDFFISFYTPVEDAGVLWNGAVRPSVRRPSVVRPSVVFRLTRAQVHNSLQINLILGIRVYDHKTLNEFENRHDPIQNGRPAAILFFSVDTHSNPQFFTNQSHTWPMGVLVLDPE